ncbi:hypothetical protein F7725_001517 [Dissostichus mawsoni]|uniref:Fibronectin type-III domain-containing protein n=1 Tax=Dissostichus mawsoni TaxID=36200 RepID=A0A7J5Y2U9_DISMA|nr:hypothetical protein F7725_001517 [Dissostichus mawsoni]
MLLGVLCILVVPQVFSEAPPAPPQDIQVDNWLLRWSPESDPDDGDVTYTAQYSSFDSGVWTDVPYCDHTSLNSCNVSSIKARSEYGCVMLRVRAERHGQNSPSVQACSKHGQLCTPDFNLIASPGSLTDYKDGPASVTIDELQEGQRYCTRVQYLYFKDTVGLPTCTQCELIPESDSRQTATIVSLVLVGVLLLVFPVIAYFLLFQRGRIKRWFQPYTFREHTATIVSLVLVGVLLLVFPVIAYFLLFQRGRIKRWFQPYTFREHLLEPIPEPLLPIHSSTEEHYDVITSMSPIELRE